MQLCTLADACPLLCIIVYVQECKQLAKDMKQLPKAVSYFQKGCGAGSHASWWLHKPAGCQGTTLFC